MYMVRHKSIYCNKWYKRVTYISRVDRKRCHIKMLNHCSWRFQFRRLADWAECNRLLLEIEKIDRDGTSWPVVHRRSDASWFPPYFGRPELN